MFKSKTGAKNIDTMVASINQKDLTFLAELLKSGKIKSIIDKRFPLKDTSEAFRYFEAGHTRGKIVITI
jgi:NADPH:quinone reductase-like Zn-dependent oxidoreductase